MAYCKKCGKEIADGASFCDGCGSAVSGVTEQNENERKQAYDGGIHKCPNCGESLKAFETVCSNCGYELRDVKSSSAVNDLVKKLDNADSDEKRSFAIKNFPVPNTKEDIFEFMFLASSNVVGDDIVSNAWAAKVEQCYQKAKLILKDDSGFANIEELYRDVQSKLKRAKFRSTVSKGVSSIQKSNEAKRDRKERREARKAATRVTSAPAATHHYYHAAPPKKRVARPLIWGIIFCGAASAATEVAPLAVIGVILIVVAICRIIKNKKNGY